MGLMDDIQRIRRANLALLCEQRGQAQVSADTRIAPAMLYQMSTAKGKSARPVKDPKAKVIESRCGLAAGWLDVDRRALSPAEQELAARPSVLLTVYQADIDSLNDSQRETIVPMVNIIKEVLHKQATKSVPRGHRPANGKS